THETSEKFLAFRSTARKERRTEQDPKQMQTLIPRHEKTKPVQRLLKAEIRKRYGRNHHRRILDSLKHGGDRRMNVFEDGARAMGRKRYDSHRRGADSRVLDVVLNVQFFCQATRQRFHAFRE